MNKTKGKKTEENFLKKNRKQAARERDNEK